MPKPSATLSVELDPLHPLQLLLDNAPLPAKRWGKVNGMLGELASSALDAAQQEIHQAANTLGNLAELARCQAIEDSGDDLCTQIHAFIRQQLPTLRAGISGEVCGTSQLEELVSQANQRWGELLGLLEPFPESQPWSSTPWHEQPACRCDEDDRDQSLPYGSQIDLVLSVLGGGAEPHRAESAQHQPPAPPRHDEPLPRPVASREECSPALEGELLSAYLDDAQRCLASMEEVVLQAENHPQRSLGLRQFCRELHTLKGASASVGLAELAASLHATEERLEAQLDQAATPSALQSLLDTIDTVREKISPLSAPATGASPSEDPVFGSAAGACESSVRVRASQLDRLMDLLGELVVLRNGRDMRINQLQDLHNELTRCVIRLRSGSEATAGSSSDTLTSLCASPLDEPLRPRTVEPALHRSGGDLEISGDIAEISRRLRQWYRPLTDEDLSLSRFIRQFRQELMQLRRLPVAGLFRRLQRAARDAARVECKSMKVEWSGESSGLEQTLQEKLYEPMLHLVRNAVSHGIEPPAQRSAGGKPEQGTVTLAAHAGANLFVFEVSDDGCGLNYDAIRRRAYQRGLLAPNRAASDQELAQLIFHPGFSTRDQASEVSGRGVGMDVVASSIDKLLGRIEVESVRGRGTTMRVSIPLCTGIEHTMVFRSHGQMFAMPMQCIRAADHSRAHDNSAAGRHVVSLRRVMAVAETDPSTQPQLLVLHDFGRRAGGSRRRTSETPQPVGLYVDQIVGPEEAVIRPLPSILKKHPLFNGVTVTGAGQVALMIDGGRAFRRVVATPADPAPAVPRPRGGDSEAPAVLVVDDSLSARRVLVHRLRCRGFRTFEASDGMEALEMLRGQNFALVLTDLEMPKLGGMELLCDVERSQACSPPVVIVSGRSETESRECAMQFGAAGYLTKPVSEPMLTELIQQLGLHQPMDPSNASTNSPVNSQTN